MVISFKALQGSTLAMILAITACSPAGAASTLITIGLPDAVSPPGYGLGMALKVSAGTGGVFMGWLEDGRIAVLVDDPANVALPLRAQQGRYAGETVYRVEKLLVHGPPDVRDVIQPLPNGLEWLGPKPAEGVFDVLVDSGGGLESAALMQLGDTAVGHEILVESDSPIFPATDREPDDPQFKRQRQWGLATIEAPRYWGVGMQTADAVVAVLDTGVDLYHDDLAANLWTNLDEVGGLHGVDDEGNGHVDDIHGWDFVEDDGDPGYPRDPAPTLARAHGTHIAGIIGAVGDNQRGVSGVCWGVQMMAVRMIDDDTGFGWQGDAARALRYAVDNGAQVVCAAWGFRVSSEALRLAVLHAQQKNVLIVAAAGNGGADGVGLDLDLAGNSFFPASYTRYEEITNVLAVMAMDRSQGPASFSNFGEQTVQVAAPGHAIWSTLPSLRGRALYGAKTGSSAAAAFVAGAAALVWQGDPEKTKKLLEASANMAHSFPCQWNSSLRLP